jgi:hypothetical protein
MRAMARAIEIRADEGEFFLAMGAEDRHKTLR